MPENIEVPISDLLLDSENARLLNPGTDQQATALSLAGDQGEKLIRMARDILTFGTDPLSLPAVIATGDTYKRYKVLEGNRRVLALKALETPSLISAALGPQLTKQLETLSSAYAANPRNSIPCILFVDETEARHWIELRHTGQNQGVGLVEWDSDAKDRYEARHSGLRSTTGQLVDFVEKFHLLDDIAKQSDQKITTNVQRLLTSPIVRDKLGISIKSGRVYSHFPFEEIRKPIAKVFEDLKSGRISVPNLYKATDRADYANSLHPDVLPDESKRLSEAIPIDDLKPAAEINTKVVTLKKTVKQIPPRPAQRTSVIARTSQLNVTEPRINTIYSELLSLSADQYANASSVLLRVFIELSIDHYITTNQLMLEDVRRNTPLAKRIKIVSAHMLAQGEIPAQLDSAMQRVANSKVVLAASTSNFNQYVHNKYVFPKPSEIRLAWDELQPFIEKIWP